MTREDSSLISSPQNSWVKEIVELRKDGNVRREQGRFFLEGRRAVAEALEAERAEICELIHCENLFSGSEAGEILRRAREQRVSVVRVSKDVFRKIADVVTPQGIAAVVKLPAWDLDRVLTAPKALLVAACGLQDPGNLGTLIRSCAAAGAAGIAALEGTADPFNAKVVRATAANLLTFPILRLKGEAWLASARARNVRLVAACARGGRPHREFNWKDRPLALCIGSEGAGLPVAIERACEERVTIPMHGHAESLNAAVAASILLFEAQSNV